MHLLHRVIFLLLLRELHQLPRVHVCVSVSVSRLRLRQRRVSFHVFVVAQTCSKQNKKKLISLFRSLCSFTKLYLLKKVLILILCYFSALSVFCCWRVLNNFCFSGFKKILIQWKLDEKCFNGSRFFEVRKKRKKVKTKKINKNFFFFQKNGSISCSSDFYSLLSFLLNISHFDVFNPSLILCVRLL